MSFNLMNVSNIEGVTKSGSITGQVTVIPAVAANTLVKIKRLSFTGGPQNITAPAVGLHQGTVGYPSYLVSKTSSPTGWGEATTCGYYALGDGWVRLQIARLYTAFTRDYSAYKYDNWGTLASGAPAIGNTGDVLEDIYLVEGKSLMIKGTLDFTLTYEIWT